MSSQVFFDTIASFSQARRAGDTHATYAAAINPAHQPSQSGSEVEPIQRDPGGGRHLFRRIVERHARKRWKPPAKNVNVAA